MYNGSNEKSFLYSNRGKSVKRVRASSVEECQLMSTEGILELKEQYCETSNIVIDLGRDNGR